MIVKSDLRVWYGFRKLTKKLIKHHELIVIYENSNSSEERKMKNIERHHIAYVRYQSLEEAESGKHFNRQLNTYSVFIDKKPFFGDIEKVLDYNFEADKNHVSIEERNLIKEKLRTKYYSTIGIDKPRKHNNQILVKMSKHVQTLEVVSINQIDVSKTNPRKSFDEKALKELTESIKEHGILQPILVRPKPFSKILKFKYELVCGERRYRAAILAGLEEIPANIRTLTDDEAFELQIVENLERKDVHPLDEADAFKKMLDSEKYTIEDIAAKMAKSESFITQRLKLIDLIEEIRTDFIAGYLGIGQAILIARCDKEKQTKIYNDAKPWSGGNDDPNYGTISEVRDTIENDSYDLKEAKFDLNDAELLKGCGACTLCPKRSGANPLLFEDMQEDRCFDEKCFDEKQEAYLIKEVSRIIHDGEDVVIVAGWGSIDNMIVEMCKQFGVEMYTQYTWRKFTQEGWVQKKGFVLGNDTDAGKYIDVWVKPQEENSSTSSGEKSALSAEEIEIKAEISKIESRADRAKELDGEKVWTEIRAIDTSEIKTIIGGLFEVEVNAVCLAMISKLGYYGNQEVKKLVGDFTVDTLQERHFTKFEYNQIQRIFFLECLPVAFGNYYSNINNYAYTEALMHYEGEKIKEIIANQKSISDVRMDKADAKIKALNEKLKALKPVEEIKVEAEEVTPAKKVKEKVKK